jgi:heterogeneous nuclear ribonucleoprotein F/H
MQPGGIDGIPGLGSMDPLEALLGPFPCARVRGLPFDATLEDVLVFFQGLVVIDVVLVSHGESGEAFVVFANPMDFQMGLQRRVVICDGSVSLL